ncbi:plasma membrane stress response protein-like protein [Hyaloscypha bicolor E]|uniref:Plasma membrane stress response protein-like protein n=1 Tax=Hyaloscypha bicolor E TaxID=1095630 RepID=A0A2J6STS4_9HELO|nr:plasma membrane stress response protein-like protein [Hyaloscypha bicolor E]PMD54184.1 plasma membrane stress response protein-like protein [Hyaloscypha bicolor E]
MASLKTLYDPNTDLGNALHTNFDVDYVIDYRFATTPKPQAEAQFVKLIQALNDVGLTTEVRNGDNCAVLVFVKVASDRHLEAEVYRSRVQDWLYGVRTAAPEKEMQKALTDEPVTEAERLRLAYLLITKPKNEGGAGITPRTGEWKGVESIFALHDHTFNKRWIKELTSKYLLNSKDLVEIRDRFGEKIAFYFAFLQSYFLFLIFPAGFGFCAWILLGQFSALYAIINALWGIIFIEYWKKQETDLAVQWGVRGVSKIQHKRPEFQHENVVNDPITGEEIKVYSPVKRLARQLLQVPFAIAAATVLGSLIAGCFAIEIFISEVYDGPFKGYLTFLPTVILTTVMPTLSALLTGFARKLTDLENYETQDSYEAAMVQKIFVLNFITSYLPIFLTAFVYVPFAQVIVPHLDVFQLAVKPFAENEKQMTAPKIGFQINPDRLKKQIIYFTVTAQIVNFALEVIMPYVKRSVFRKVKEVQADRAAKKGGSPASPTADDHPEESAFLVRVRNEAELGAYDVTSDFREMIVQFGYLSLFSVVWPLTGVSFFINNWIELRGDALKIALETQRPVPWRADSIGPWLDSLAFLSWLGSLTSSALVYLFSGDGLGPDGAPWNIKAWGLLLTMFFSEHIYLGVKIAVRTILSKIDSPGLQKERAERFIVRKQYIQESIGEEAAGKAAAGGIAAGEKISRNTLEEEARPLKVHGTAEQKFWQRQPSQAETIAVGKQYIAKAAPNETKETKKEL